MNTQTSTYGPPPHPAHQSSRQLGPIATLLLALAIAIGIIAASGVLALVLQISG